MKIKAAEIARQLGISKATVSLALNNKPGVSNETKKQILQYINQVESGVAINPEKNIIKIICYSKQIQVYYQAEVDLWTGVLAEFSQEAKKDGFTLGIDYLGDDINEIEKLIDECNGERVAGVILFATEMIDDDFLPFKRINKPMVVYDNDFKDINYSYVMIDNHSGVNKVIDYLVSKGHREIVYLANSGDNFNFRQRRLAFKNAININNIHGQIISVGSDVETSYEEVKKGLLNSLYTKTIVCENYQVSIGAIKAIKELNLMFDKDISIIGIDEVPDYFCFGHKLTALKVSHNQRAFMAVTLLKKEILESQCDKFRVYSTCELLNGDTA